ncbi:MAG: hypothetical protein ABW298_12735 [Candidatus Binatia bacterium]
MAESFLAPTLVDTGDLDTDDAFPFGFELSAKRGPLTIQAEYLAPVVSMPVPRARLRVYGSASSRIVEASPALASLSQAPACL